MARAANDRTARRRAPADPAARILDATLALAEEKGWASVRLRNVAERLDMPLDAVLAHYRDLDAVADAWLRRGWQAMLQPTPEDFPDWPPPRRIELIVMRWFDALAPHRRVTGEMIAGKFWYAHPHHWVPAVFNLSRTILWVREAARLDATGRQRQMEEVGLTGLFLATLAVWLRDDSENQQRTRRFLERRLAGADRLMQALWQRRTQAPDIDSRDEQDSPDEQKEKS